MRYLFTLLILIGGIAHAAVYKTVKDGEVIYSDQPGPGAERMKLPELPSYKPPPLPRKAPAGKSSVQPGGEYDAMAIVKPQDDATVRNNLGIVQVEVSLEPALKPRSKHRIQYYLDNQPHGPQVENTGITFSNLERGEHTISASVVNANGNELIRTEPVTVHIKRESALNQEDRFEPPGPPPDPDAPAQPEPPKNPGDRVFNPNIRTTNPNVRSTNPNVRSANPNVITPPPAANP
jgi:hypothetical protein